MTRPEPDTLDEIATGYRAAQVLLTANRLGLFACLGSGRMTADELASALETDQRATRILCDALSALSLLEKTDGRYANGTLAREFLVSDAPTPRNALLLHTAKLYERWGKLYDTVKTGKPVPDEALAARLRGDARDFALAMADVGRQSASTTADALDLGAVRDLLDLGGGPGLYAMEFARRHPELRAVVFDNEETLRVTRSNIEQEGLAERVSLRAGDAFEDDLGGPYDLVFASNLVHIYSAEENRRLVARCAEVLRPGGRLAIKDFSVNADHTAPLGGALFAVNMLVGTERGDCYSEQELKVWFEAAGLEHEATRELTPLSQLVVARA